MQRYFAIEKKENTIILQESDIHHIKNVMRNKIDDYVEAILDNKLYLCKIKSINPIIITIEKEENSNNELPIEFTVGVSLVSEQKFDLILQKLTELGVSKIIPLKTERSIVKIDEKRENKKIERWTNICKEASEQSHRNIIPKIENIKSLKEIINEPYDIKLVCSLNEKTKKITEYLNKKTKKILFVIGPEGGLSLEEEKLLLNNSFQPVTLGKRVLRVETATLYVASIINYIYEE